MSNTETQRQMMEDATKRERFLVDLARGIETKNEITVDAKNPQCPGDASFTFPDIQLNLQASPGRLRALIDRTAARLKFTIPPSLHSGITCKAQRADTGWIIRISWD